MPVTNPLATFALCTAALLLGALAGWAWCRLRSGSLVPASAHREELQALRSRYRQRLRAMRDALNRQKLAEEQMKSRLRAAVEQQAAQERGLAEAQAELSRLHHHLAEQSAVLDGQGQELAAAAGRERQLCEQLAEARERINRFEQEHGLLRIERDELAARTQRLQVLKPEESAVEPAREPTGSGAPRAEIADRDARIHELECQLRESEGRASELQSSLNTWKFRIAPLALHMELQRDKARRAAQAAPKAPAIVAPDDLLQIRGIGRALQKKLAAAGITRFNQLAEMSPAELANLAVRLGVAASRPQRDRWAEQARDLCV